MKKLLVTFVVAVAFLVGGMHDGDGAVAPWKTSYGPGYMTEGGGGGGYPPLKSPCGGYAQGYCVNSAGKIVPCVCIKWEICGIWTFIWMPVNIA